MGKFSRGHAKVGGRQLGSVNKITAQDKAILQHRAALKLDGVIRPLDENEQARIRVALAMEPMDPLQVMAMLMQKAMMDDDRHSALQCASSLAPYVHAKLLAAEVRVGATDVTKTPVAELFREADEIRERLRNSPLLEHEGEVRSPE